MKNKNQPLGDASAWTGLLGDEKPRLQVDDAVTAGRMTEEVTAPRCSEPPSEELTAAEHAAKRALEMVGVVMRKPATAVEALAAGRAEIVSGNQCENRISVLIVWALELSGQKVSAFVKEKSRELAVVERQLYYYLAAGRLLLCPEFASLPDRLKVKAICGSKKMAVLWNVKQAHAGRLGEFLAKYDPRQMNCDEVAEAGWEYEQKMLTDEQLAAKNKRDARKAAEKGADLIRKALKPLGDVADEELTAAARRVGAARVFDHGLRLMAAAVDSQVEAADGGTVSAEAVAQWRAALEAGLAEVARIGQAE
jgi:hypothetical protein